MKWLMDESGDLVNVALAQHILISPVEDDAQPEDVIEAQYAVIAVFPNESSTWLFSGSKYNCETFLNKLAGRLLSDPR